MKDLIFMIAPVLVMLFLTGAWTVVPEGKDEKFSKKIKVLASFLFAIVGIILGLLCSSTLAAIGSDHKVCQPFIEKCLAGQPVVEIGILQVITVIYIYGCGVWYGFYFKKNTPQE